MTDRWEKYIGIHHEAAGRCWGLVRSIYDHEYGISLPDYDICHREAADEEISREIEGQRDGYERIPAPAAPCIVALRNSDDPEVCNHVGVYVGDGVFLHTTADHGSVRARIDHPFWRNMIEGYYVPCKKKKH